MGVAGGQLAMGLGRFGQRIGGRHADFEEALAGLLNQLEAGLGPDLRTRVRARSPSEYLNAELETSLCGRQGGDPAAISDQFAATCRSPRRYRRCRWRHRPHPAPDP